MCRALWLIHLMGKDDEMILVVERSLFDELRAFQGLKFEIERYLEKLLDPANQKFVRRGDAEDDPSLKQLIPYCIVESEGQILRYTRGQGGGEDRLHAKQSIGIGGHINDVDHAADGSTYDLAVARELHEELVLPEEFDNAIVALLNDDSNPVGQVHLGVVHRISLPDISMVKAAEDDISGLEWVTAAELLAGIERLESWSAICAGGIEQLLED